MVPAISNYINTTVSHELVLFASSRTKLLEGDTINSHPPGFFLKHRHGQLIVYNGEPDNASSLILWQTHPYLSHGSSIQSYVVFQADCNLVIYSETESKQNQQDVFHSVIWESSCPNSRQGLDNCFLAWSLPEEKLAIINSSTEYSPKSSDTFFIEKGWNPRSNYTSTTDQELVLLLSPNIYAIRGFVVESEPKGLYVQHLDGGLYVYRGGPNIRSSTLIWKTDDPYVFDGDSDLIWSTIQSDCNLIVYAPVHNEECCPQYLWKTATEVAAADRAAESCFLAWVPSEERLAIYEGVIDQPGREIWTSKDFHWIPMHSDLSETGQSISMVLTRTSSALSILGSGLILGIILARWKKNKKIFSTRDRLIFSMSFLDFLASIAHFLDVTPIPQGTYGIVGARGTQATCTAQGFFIQMGFAVPLYNCMLCIHALLIVRFKWKDEFIAARIEPFMHTVGIGYALATSLLGIFLQLYNSNGSFCWVEGFPHDCNITAGIKCLRGENAYTFQWLFAGVMLIFAFTVIISSMGSIYFFIRKNVRLIQNRYNTTSASDRSLKEIVKQAFLYVTAFLITFIWPMSVAIQRHYEVTIPLWQNLLLSFFFPLQGFWNFLIFIRPMYNRINRQNPDRSCVWVLRTAIVREAAVTYGRGRAGRRGDNNYRMVNVDVSRPQRVFLFVIKTVV